MEPLNLPEYPHKIKESEGKKIIFDVIRKRYVVLTPEEWVRQSFIQYLSHEKGFPVSLMAIEHPVLLHKQHQRSDIVVYDRKGKPRVIIECKAPKVLINQKVFDQIARYNMVLKAPYLLVTNGMKHYCCHVDFQNESYRFLEQIPDFADIN